MESHGTKFIEIYCRCSLDELVRRDVKGLYKEALSGEIQNFTGVYDPYEEPKNPDILVESDNESVEDSLRNILSHLEEQGLIDKTDAQQ